MLKIAFGYSFLFYSLYRYFATKLDLSRDWPQGWSVIALSGLITFVYLTVRLTLIKVEVLSVNPSSQFSWVSSHFYDIGIYLLALALNSLYFFGERRWLRYVQIYDSLPGRSRILGHTVSGLAVAGVVMAYLFRLYTFDK